MADPAAQRALWRVREQGAGLATRSPGGAEAFPGWEDAAVPPDRLGEYLRGLRGLLRRHELRGLSYGHFGDGCVHTRIDFDFLRPLGRDRFRAFVEDAADLVISLGGSLSGEHGDGQARGELLGRMYGDEVVELFGIYKAVWDPRGRLNPGVLVRPRRLDEDLRLEGPATRPVVDLAFAYTSDGGDFAKAVRRCVGVGRCRSESGGVMCPSYRATAAEEHSTRGRAHLLLEMLEGDVVTDRWRADEVREALDLCLSCKGCLSDCPVSVDISTYKAEFLHRYYRRRLRPASHYSMGFLPLWARLAARAPGVVNVVTADAVAGRAVRRLGGIAQQRPIPRFAEETFTGWFRSSFSRAGQPPAPPPDSQGRVVVWPDTFTNYLAPDVGRAATRVLLSAGLHVTVPRRAVCCGLTWISSGQLGIARRVLRRTLATIASYVGSDVWVVGLEPSCTATLRSDVRELLPDHPGAEWLESHVLTFAEALDRLAPAAWAPQVGRTTISQTHCHQHAVLGTEADVRLMQRLGIRNTALDTGCCGLAGSFGFEREHLEVSLAVAEGGFAPALRAAASDIAVLADGFSCRTQAAHIGARESVHLAQLIDAALSE